MAPRWYHRRQAANRQKRRKCASRTIARMVARGDIAGARRYHANTIGRNYALARSRRLARQIGARPAHHFY